MSITNQEKQTPQARSQSYFGKTASAYLTSTIHAKGHDLQQMVDVASECLGGSLEGFPVLDVATGAGHTALAFAKAGAQVTATDITPEMLTTTREHAASQGITLTVQEAAAEALPFENDTFTCVTCRIAAHHFASVPTFLAEAARVLQPNGYLLIVDNVVSENSTLATPMNSIEKHRDASHVRALSVSEWVHQAAAHTLDCMYVSRWQRRKNFPDWCARAGMSTSEQVGLEQMILELDKPIQDYLGVEQVDGKLAILCHEAALLTFIKR
ncbi:MAG: class I SAM-dependent methyltransferase [Deinococcota bacterium]